MSCDRTELTIQRIADALGVSVSAFHERKIHVGNTGVDRASEERELLSLFSEIQDPEVRAACLNYVRCCASAARQDSDQPK